MAIDNRGVDRFQSFVIEAKLARRGHAQIVMHNVGPFYQAFEHHASFRLLQIEGDGSFATLASRKRPIRRGASSHPLPPRA